MASTWVLLVFAAAGFITVAAVDGTDNPAASPDSGAMKALKDSLVFPPGSPLLPTWSNLSDPCRWKGVRCDGNNRVRMIDISNYSLDGNLSVLKEIPGLKQVRLNLNRFSGEIPDLSGLTSLQEFIASNNSLTGPVPETLGKISSLQDLSLANNYLTGAIPPTIAGLTNLLRLDLSYNRLTGEVPDMSRLVSLKEFIAGYNGLSGPVPETLGNITSLQEVSLVFNNLTGTIPPAVARLTNLLRLDLSYNKLSGEIPELSSLRSLQKLYAYSNQLTGQVPESLANIPTLQDVSLAYNSLKGTIPRNITRLTNLLRLDLSYNYQLCGGVPSGFAPNVTLITTGNPRINQTCPVGGGGRRR